MKHILLAMFVFFASMPLHASGCEMHQSEDKIQSQHGDMMDHGDMDMDMDCCDHDPIDPTDNCDQMSHCGASASSVVMIDTSEVNVAFLFVQHHANTHSTPTTSQFGSPPFRPPIA